MRLNPLYAPDGMTSARRSTEYFDDGLVHNHNWAVSADEAYPSQDQGSVTEYGRGSGVEISPFQSIGATIAHDHHDDGLVHNHHWAVSGQ